MKQLKDEYAMQDGDEELTVSTVLERMMRYQQVIGGTFPFELEGEYHTKPIPGGNPKIDEMMELLSGLPETVKVIIWARFVPEIGYITDAIREEYGESSVVQFYGATDNERTCVRFNKTPRYVLSSAIRRSADMDRLGRLQLTLSTIPIHFPMRIGTNRKIALIERGNTITLRTKILKWLYQKTR
jgi:hypothetical protein